MIPVPKEFFVAGNLRDDRPLRSWMNQVSNALGATATPSAEWANKVVRVASPPNAGALAPSAFGWGTPPTFNGSGNIVPGGSFLTAFPRLTSSTTALANAGVSTFFGSGASGVLWLGDVAGRGGFRLEMTFGVEVTQSTLRLFVGVNDSGAFTIAATDPSVKTTIIALACDSGDTNMQIMHNDAAGTATKIDLGALFPKTTGASYRAVFTAAANATSVDYEVTRLDGTTASASGTIATNLPANTAILSPIFAVSNGATAAVATLAFLKLQAEQGFPA